MAAPTLYELQAERQDVVEKCHRLATNVMSRFDAEYAAPLLSALCAYAGLLQHEIERLEAEDAPLVRDL